MLAPPSAAYQPPAATGIDITNGTAAFATGNGTLVDTAYYSVRCRPELRWAIH